MRRLASLALAGLALGVALALASTAAAAGPWLGIESRLTDPASETLAYVTSYEAGATTVSLTRKRDDRVLAQTTLAGHWGVPRVTLNGGVEGLSANGRVLVLAQPYLGAGELQARTAFAVLDTKPLALRRIVSVKGDFGFDALAPDGRMLYLIEHASQEDLLSYRVRAYDLRAGKLLARIVADKRQKDWLMNGFPVARAASPDGRWVYTLYSAGDNYPFVHMLDTKLRTAICVGLPWSWTPPNDRQIQAADLAVDGGKLVVAGNHGFGTRFAIDTRTFRVAKL